jgi:hypothetical protein
MSEARKYHLSLVVGHQYIAQMDETVRDAIFGNVGTIIAFRVGAEDAEMLEKELTPEFLAQDIVNLGKREVYIKLMIDGLASRAFSARTMDTPGPLPVNNRQKVIEWSREHYAANREEVEKSISKWHAPVIEERPAATRPAPRGEPADRGPSRAAYPPPRQEPVRQPSPSAFIKPAPRQRTEAPRPVSLSEALKQGPVDFRGRKLQPNPVTHTNVRYGANPVTHTNVRYGANPVTHTNVRYGAKPTPARPKVEVDVEGLRRVLEESGVKKK